MMHSFHAKNFRGFRDLKIENLKRVNLIAGMNNVGKTALLEAVFLHLGPDNPELGLRINAMRGLEEFKIDLEETWGNLFYNFDTKTIIELSRQDEKGHARKLMISFSAAPPLRHISSSRNGKGKSSKILGSITTAIDAMELTMQYKEDGGKPNLTHLLIVDDGEKRSFQVKRERRVVSIPGVLLTTRAPFTRRCRTVQQARSNRAGGAALKCVAISRSTLEKIDTIGCWHCARDSWRCRFGAFASFTTPGGGDGAFALNRIGDCQHSERHCTH